MRIAHQSRMSKMAACAALIGAMTLGGCRVLTVEQDRALRDNRAADFDAGRYVEKIWAAEVLPTLQKTAVPAGALVSAIGSGLDSAGAKFGRQAGEGSPWTFVVSGSGTVAAVDKASRHGIVDIVLAGTVPARTARLQIGPVVSGAAIRDGLTFVSFNDFVDQLAFADVGRALTARALNDLRPSIGKLRPGQAVRFMGVANVRYADASLMITPVTISVDVAN